ncbi:hypothetical protein [Atlantibacter hermannii]|uniref:hypothetical protein n=1 Tax=Atlantibacter hermannii TaxID=565 RepID=UPI0028AA4E8A|nr:hypothetical protein [Atlantibacter hermannii]
MIKFKYSFTLFVESRGWILPVTFALLLLALVDAFNNFYWSIPLLYFAINTLALFIGWWIGIFAYHQLINWMRKHTIWEPEWSNLYPPEK